MKDITEAEMEIVLKIAKSPERDYNANNLSKVVSITPMGALKILKKLEKEDILKSKKIGNTSIYKINVDYEYAQKLVSFLLLKEALSSESRVKRWVLELKKIKSADLIILYGSVLEKENPNDIDVLLVTNKKRFEHLKKEIDALNRLTNKKIHPMYQTFLDIIENIKKKDKPLLNAIKGIIVSGEDKFIEVYNESYKE